MIESRRYGELGLTWSLGPVEWKRALLFAVPVSLSILGLFYYWFAVADRYAIFLYYHLGATPLCGLTGSRYWMSGLVASGAVMVAYTSVSWLIGRIAAVRHRDYSSPAWWHVWMLCVAPLVFGIPLITMTVNWPTLPFSNATACVVATLVGLAFALVPGSCAAQRPSELGWLTLDGVGLMPSLLLLRAIELPGRGIRVSAPVAYLGALGGIFAGAIWLCVTTGLRAWRRKSPPRASTLFALGLCLSYLMMPLVHHLTTPTEYRYISAASNFFAFSAGLQFAAFLVAAILAIGITRLRLRLIRRRI